MSFVFTLPPDYVETPQLIGEGAYGTVWTCTRRIGETKTQQVAIKVLRDFACEQREMFTQERKTLILRTFREIEVLLYFRNCEEFISIVDMYTSVDGYDLYIVMPYVPHSLKTAIDMDPIKGNGFGEDTTGYILMQILVGLRRMARCRCVHRDLTPSNILLDLDSKNVFLADFGLARFFTPGETAMTIDVVTLPYRPPELLLRSESTDNAIDVWSAGMVALDMLIGCSPFLGAKDAVNQLNSILHYVAKPMTTTPESTRNYVSGAAYDYLSNSWATIESYSPSIRQLLSQCCPQKTISDAFLEVLEAMLQFAPKERKTAEEILAMPFFTQGPDAAVMRSMMENEEPTEVMRAALHTETAYEMLAMIWQLCRHDKERFQTIVIFAGSSFQENS